MAAYQADSRPPVLLIVAAGPLQIPAFHEARSLGCEIIAVDQSASAPGMRLADKTYAIDIKQSWKIVQIATKEDVGAVVSICTDFAIRTVAAVADALGLAGLRPNAALGATDKRWMRRALLTWGVPSPKFCEVSDAGSASSAAARLTYPVALKIPKSAGSRGVYRVDSPSELLQRYEEARSLEPSADLLLEEWLEGPEVSVEGCCVGATPHIVQITDKLLFPGPNPVEAGHTQPTQLCQATQDSIRATTSSGIRALGLEDCGFHAELKVTANGPRIIEIAARLGGDRIATHLTPLSTGVNLVRAVVELALGRKPSLAPSRHRGSAIRYFDVPGPGWLHRVDGLDSLRGLPGVEQLSFETEAGEPLAPGLRLRQVRSSLDRLGCVIFSGENAVDAAHRAEAAIRKVAFHVRPEKAFAQSAAGATQQ